MELPAHAAGNRAYWDGESDAYQARHGTQISSGMAWGVWQIPESELNVLGEVRDRDVLELGCGAAQWSIALARLGARPVGLDLSSRQLEHARRAVDEAGVEVTLIEANAEDVPLGDESVDLIFCDHGAFNFADPRLLMPQAARLLRPGGLLAFSMPSPLLDLFWDEQADQLGERLRNDYFELSGFTSADDGTTDFQLPYGEWIRLFRQSGLIVEDLIEIRAPEGAESSYDLVPLEWARRWPAENIWKASKPAR